MMCPTTEAPRKGLPNIVRWNFHKRDVNNGAGVAADVGGLGVSRVVCFGDEVQLIKAVRRGLCPRFGAVVPRRSLLDWQSSHQTRARALRRRPVHWQSWETWPRQAFSRATVARYDLPRGADINYNAAI